MRVSIGVPGGGVGGRVHGGGGRFSVKKRERGRGGWGGWGWGPAKEPVQVNV